MITNKETGWTEPTIVINGRTLTFAEAMAVRVAVSSFRMYLNEPENTRWLGIPLAEGYDRALATVEEAMHKSTL